MKNFLVIAFLLLMTSLGWAQKKYSSPKKYINKHSEVAQELMRETGVPASIILAVAIHESWYGNSRVAEHLNNHFGIKGKNNNTEIKSAFKGYNSVMASYWDFAKLIQRKKAVQPLLQNNDTEDYRSWVKNIAKSGYSTTTDWSRKVLSMIDKYDLDQYDEQVNLN